MNLGAINLQTFFPTAAVLAEPQVQSDTIQSRFSNFFQLFIIHSNEVYFLVV